MQTQVQETLPTPRRGFCPQTRLRHISGVPLIEGMQPVRVPYSNVKDGKKEGDSSSDDGSKLYEEYNAFGDFQNNNDDSDEDEDGNSGHDNIFVGNLVWEDIDNDLVMLYIPEHYCGTHGLKEVVEKLFQTVLECIMLTNVVSSE